MFVRHAEPADYARVIDVVDQWWGGRQMAAMLPKLLLRPFPRHVVRRRRR
jgi:hypothetical protein